MTSCISCSLLLNEDVQHYDVENMAPDLFDILQQSIQCEIPNDSVVCEDCFNNLTTSLDAPVLKSKPPRISEHDINKCFCCQASLLRRRSIVLEGAQHNEIVRSSALEVPRNVRICYKCWFRTHRLLQKHQQCDTGRDIIQQNSFLVCAENCISCDVPLFGRRTNILREGPEKDIISIRIHREVPENARVCHNCWYAARNQHREEHSSNVVQRVLLPRSDAAKSEPDSEVEHNSKAVNNSKGEHNSKPERNSKCEHDSKAECDSKSGHNSEAEPECASEQVPATVNQIIE